MSNKRIALLGSTGSIGLQALDIVRSHPGDFSVEVLTASTNSDLLIDQALEFRPDTVVIANTGHYEKVSEALAKAGIKVFAGSDSVSQVVSHGNVDIVVNAIVGFAGFEPTVRSLEAGKTVALANKESIVAGGALVSSLIARGKGRIIPVDSEHSAIFQCLTGESEKGVEKIYLTASGGPFLNTSRENLKKAGPDEALMHPNWDMGQKITIDSASMMNKGLEVIEAKWLFGLRPEQIQVVIHPQSVVHSMVQFIDGSVKAQLGNPDMRTPILYALSYPRRLPSGLAPFNILEHPRLSFEAPDLKKFRNLALAFDALARGGNVACAMNAANEIAVHAFLRNKITFLQMPEIIEKSMEKTAWIPEPGLEDLKETDQESRRIATNLIKE